MKNLIFIALSIIITSCASTNDNIPTQRQLIGGRELGIPETYQVKTPVGWQRINTPAALLSDTMEPLCRFSVPGTTIEITVHNFPGQRVPPEAQAARWMQQFDTLDDASTERQAFGGFAGLCFFGTGRQKEKELAVLAWAMQLGPEHLRTLQDPLAGISADLSQQMCADYTIKAVGVPHEIASFHAEIAAFARTFELIEEIPEAL